MLHLWRALRARWRFALTLTLGAGVVTAGIVLMLPSYYTASAAFQAETPVPSQLLGSLGGLASQLGNLGLSGQNNAQLFGDLLTSDGVLRRVGRASYPWQGGSAPLGTIYGLQREDSSLQLYNTVRKLRKETSVDVNVRTGVVRFSVEARGKLLAYAIAETTLAVVNDVNVGLRQQRAAAERAFTTERADDSRRGLDSAEAVLTKFYEDNRVISSSPALQMEEARLKRGVDMAQQVYVQLRLQAEQAAIQEVRNTPAITVVDPPVEPVKRSWPRRTVAVICGAIAGFLIALLRIAAPTLDPAARA